MNCLPSRPFLAGLENTLLSGLFNRKFLKIGLLIFGLNLLFFLMQCIIISSFSLKDEFLSLFNSEMHLPMSQYWRFISFGFSQIFCYGILSLLFALWLLPGLLYLPAEKSEKIYVFRAWLSSVALIFSLNIWIYPASRFNWFILPGHSALPLVLITLILFVHQSRFSFYAGFISLRRNCLAWASFLFIGFLLCVGIKIYERYSVKTPEVSSQPNVILIGLDDLREDTLKDMPILSNFLSKSTNFLESITPEARTFVAWTSLLTGLYPKEHDIHFDMQSVDGYTPPGSLASILKGQGYSTFYSTDDNQYADVNPAYGFDHLLVPKMDTSEYLLSVLNDFPLSNLISQTWLGKWLFPDTYNNRASPFVYEPWNYNRDVLTALKKIPNRPIFIAIHFNLSHQPFYWSKRPLPVTTWNTNINVSQVYFVAAQDMDEQLGEFLKALKQNGFLNNAIVAVFSDHGESLGLPKERLVSLDTYLRGPHSSTETIPALSLYSDHLLKFDEIFGHGTDVLSKMQWQQILGIKWFSHAQYQGNIAQRVSLIDIKPTILDLLGISGSHSTGQSLKSMVLWGKALPEDRYFFTDTGFNPFAIQDLYHVSADEVNLSLRYFIVLPNNGRLVIRPSLLPELLTQVQHAVVYKNWILAAYPARHHKQVFVLVDMDTRQWTDDFSTPFAQKAPVSDLLNQMQAFYGDEIKYAPVDKSYQ